MTNNNKYSTYNQIIKEFEIYIVKSTNNKYKLELVKRSDGPRPPKPPGKHRKSKFDILLERIDRIDSRLNAYDKMFKAHGWIK